MIKALQTFAVRPSLPEPLAPLEGLASNLRWVWHPPTQELFRWADPALWESTGNNPVRVLAGLSPARLEVLAEDAGFLEQLAAVQRRLTRYLEVRGGRSRSRRFPASRTSARSSASPTSCRPTRVASACSPGTT